MIFTEYDVDAIVIPLPYYDLTYPRRETHWRVDRPFLDHKIPLEGAINTSSTIM